MLRNAKVFLFLICMSLLVLSSCGSKDNTPAATTTSSSTAYSWTFQNGYSSVNQAGSYGSTTGTTGTPGARYGSISWKDASGNMYLFGGFGYDSNGSCGYLNDLWKYDGSNWVWVGGSKLINQVGTYGAATGTTGTPGARYGAVSWVDSSRNVWLFGGTGYGSTSAGSLNDLWKFDGTNWTWMGGSKTVNQIGVYGATTGTTGTPGSRYGSVAWIDTGNNLWLFGGYGYDSTTTNNTGYLNDLWKFNGTSWTWVSGSSTMNQVGSYGAATGTTGTPGARYGAIAWIDATNNLWLFSGEGYDASTVGYLNDLWKFDGTNWTWVSGASTINQTGTYGTQNVPDRHNVPGARFGAVAWIDSSKNFWFFGGIYNNFAAGASLIYNDLWKFDGSSWTWVSGSKTINQRGNYGTGGTPGSRYGSVSWINTSGYLYLFGGVGYDTTTNGYLNDLWYFRPL